MGDAHGVARSINNAVFRCGRPIASIAAAQRPDRLCGGGAAAPTLWRLYGTVQFDEFRYIKIELALRARREFRTHNQTQ